MEAKLRLSIKKNGEHVYGAGRQKLLLAVDKLGSLNKAAASLEMSYRAAWGKIKISEERLGFKLLKSRTGGAGGGGADLTPQARVLMEKYSRFRRNAARQVEREFRAAFTP